MLTVDNEYLIINYNSFYVKKSYLTTPSLSLSVVLRNISLLAYIKKIIKQSNLIEK